MANKYLGSAAVRFLGNPGSGWGNSAFATLRFWCAHSWRLWSIDDLPMGMLYLLFAPFPWQVGSLRQSITLPEMIIWWVSFPMLILGLWFAIKYRLRMIAPILIFTIMLTLSYSVFQGNIGTAYRQRAQLLVFYFIFVAVGFVLLKEKREERKRQQSEGLLAQQAASALTRSNRSSR